jgi:hypothetical protein
MRAIIPAPAAPVVTGIEAEKTFNIQHSTLNLEGAGTPWELNVGR